MNEGGIGIFIVFYLAIIVLMIASMWKVFEKAGQPGWAAIVPIYNMIIMLKIVGKPWWWLLLMIFIPYVGMLVWGIWMINLMSLSFGKTSGFTIGLILLGIVFWPILGFGDAEYNGPAAADAAVNYPEYAEE
ncbi:MAG: hypothetical protein B6I20_05155 [Bacteroidetes bacterium 4572_117]|nr:MAG: hypothetical protein B6I20_05155 [Bacteroidetes bacterium 4572_117]